MKWKTIANSKDTKDLESEKQMVVMNGIVVKRTPNMKILTHQNNECKMGRVTHPPANRCGGL